MKPRLRKKSRGFRKEGGEKVKSRIVVPAADKSGLNAQLAEHFGRAPFFAVVDLNESGEVSDVKTVPNVGEHFGGRGHAHDRILELQPNVIIAHGMGERGLIGFQKYPLKPLLSNFVSLPAYVCEKSLINIAGSKIIYTISGKKAYY